LARLSECLLATSSHRLLLGLSYRLIVAPCLCSMCISRSFPPCTAAAVTAASRSGFEAASQRGASNLVHRRVARSHDAAGSDMFVSCLLLRKGPCSIVSWQSLKTSEECGGGGAQKRGSAATGEQIQRRYECRGRRAPCRRGDKATWFCCADQSCLTCLAANIWCRYRRSSTTRPRNPRQTQLPLRRHSRRMPQKTMRQPRLLQMTLPMQTMRRCVRLECIIWLLCPAVAVIAAAHPD
jgi:hypothetical protein